MKPTSLIASVLTVGVLGNLGCESRDEKARGTGASGQPLAVLAIPQVDLERFVKYTPEQDKIIQLMHQPFDAVSKAGLGADEPDAKAVAEKIKGVWDDVKFIKVKEGRLLRYRVTLDTTHGDLVLDFFEGHTPDVVRNFVARANAKLLNARHITLEDGMLVIGNPLEKQPYTLPARSLPAPLPKGALFDFNIDGRAAGNRVGISLRRVSAGGAKVTMFGHVNNADVNDVLSVFAAALAKDPNSIVIKDARVQTFDLAVFDGGAVRLPTLNKKGELEIPDLAMFTNVANPEFDPKNLPVDPRFGAKLKKSRPDPLLNSLPESDTMKSTNPNAPPIKKSDVAPAKDDKEPPKKS